jgi:protoheme ferro-lyase
VRSVMQRGKWPSPHIVCYQSKVGSSRWLEPSLTGTIRNLAQRGRKYLLVIPVAFVTEHVETLHEINIEAREDAEHAGIRQFEMMPALNSHPAFIRCLTELVTERISTTAPFTQCRLLGSTSSRGEPSLCPWHQTGPAGRNSEEKEKKSLTTR